MKIDYNIIWVEDKIDSRPFERLVKRIDNFLSEQFFNVNIVVAEDFNEFKKKFEENLEFDLVITDLNLSEGKGSDVINYIRTYKNILTEIFFYSANDKVTSEALENSSRISFYRLDNHNLYRDLQTKLEEVIALTISKFQHIVAMRGMIMHETSSLDILISNILHKIIVSGDVEQILNIIKKKFLKSTSQIAKELEESSDIEQILYLIGADHRVRGILRNIENDDMRKILCDYAKEIVSIRNKFAHAELKRDENSKEYFIHGKSGLEFNEELCKAIRKNIIKHKVNLDNLSHKFGIN